MLSAVLLLVSFASLVKADVALAPDAKLAYVPNLAGNIVIGALYTIATLIVFYHVFFTGPKQDKWGLVLPIGLATEAIGFWVRIAQRYNQSSIVIYIIWYLFVVLSPAAYLAFNYILFGRFSAALEGHKPGEMRSRSQYSFLAPHLIKRIFVISDIVTFLIQAGGGGLQTSGKLSTIETGNHIFLTGTILQTVSYLLFTALTVFASIKLYKQDPVRFSPFNFREPSIHLASLLYLSSVGILIRSCYRIAEFAVGYSGYLYTTEIYTFVLDAVPLLIAIGVWTIFWPGLLLRTIRDNPPATANSYKIDSVETSRNIEEPKGEKDIYTSSM